MQPTEAYTAPAAPAGVAERDVEETRPLPRNQERLLTVGEIAEYLQIKPKTIYNWASLGIIPCIRMNKRIVRFDLGKVLKWLARYEQKGRRTYKVDWDEHIKRLER